MRCPCFIFHRSGVIFHVLTLQTEPGARVTSVTDFCDLGQDETSPECIIHGVVAELPERRSHNELTWCACVGGTLGARHNHGLR